MRILLILDGNIDVRKIKKIIEAKKGKITLFPVTSAFNEVREIEKLCIRCGWETEIVDSARLIDAEVDVIRGRIHAWSASLGRYQLRNRSIIEWFSFGRGDKSTWWFSLLAEKNCLKTLAFFRIAQLQAIEKKIVSEDYDLCIVYLYDKDLKRACKLMCDRHLLKRKALSSYAGHKTR